MSCHNSPSGTIAGWDFANLNGPSLTSPNRNQLDEFERLGIVEGVIKPAWKSASMTDPSDKNAPLDLRARSYLSINCAHCHCRGGGGTVALELPFTITPDKMNAIDQLPTQGNFGIENARVIAPGDPYRSVLYYRLATCGAGHMPKLWIRENDSLGIQLIHDWIASMASDHPLSSTPMLPAFTVAALPKRLSTIEALRCFHAFDSNQVAENERKTFLTNMTTDADPVVRGLFDRFLPASQRVQRLGAQVDRQKILAIPGDPQKGAIRYRESAAMQCRNCHRIAGQGQSVGPDLDGIAKKRSREDLLDSLLEPSKRIEPEFHSHSVLTSDGATITGLLVKHDEKSTTLRSADGKLHVIESAAIEEARTLGVSLMPTGLVAEMTADELVDLLSYLESLK